MLSSSIPHNDIVTDESSTEIGGKYRFGSGQRKLPRPIVFWSDNEKDAFRRNKILQTHYYIRLDDIEVQRKASKRAIRFEAHKFREKTGYVRNKGALDMGSARGSSSASHSKYIFPNDKHVDDDILSNQDEFGSEPEGNSGRKSTVRFSVYKEYIDNDENGITDQNDDVDYSEVENTSWIYRKVRSVSADPGRINLQTTCNLDPPRSKSTVPSLVSSHRLSIGSARSSEGSRPNSETGNTTGLRPPKEPKHTKRTQSPNKMFFDRSQGAFELKRELRRLAKNRKNSNNPPPFSMEHALSEQKQKYFESRTKVTEYLHRLKNDSMFQHEVKMLTND